MTTQDKGREIKELDWEKYKEEIKSIVELIEDKNFPARRNITDYIEQMFGYPKEMSLFIKGLYDKSDELLHDQ